MKLAYITNSGANWYGPSVTQQGEPVFKFLNANAYCEVPDEIMAEYVSARNTMIRLSDVFEKIKKEHLNKLREERKNEDR
jgi:hypothetical protein